MKDLITPMAEMTDDQLLERLRQIRHNRTVNKPATATRAKKEAKKGNVGRLNKAADLFGNLSEADKAALIKQLKGEQ